MLALALLFTGACLMVAAGFMWCPAAGTAVAGACTAALGWELLSPGTGR